MADLDNAKETLIGPFSLSHMEVWVYNLVGGDGQLPKDPTLEAWLVGHVTGLCPDQ